MNILKCWSFESYDQALIHEALCLGYLRQHRYREAQRFAQKWGELNPQSYRAAITLGEVSKAGNEEEGLDHFERALQLKPKDFTARVKIVRLLNQMYRSQECLDMLGPIIAEDPDNLIWQKELAYAYLGLGQLAKAKELAQILVTSSSGKEQIEHHMLLGDIELKLENYQEAETHFRAVLAKKPRSMFAVEGLIKCLAQKGADSEKELQRIRGIQENIQAAMKKDQWFWRSRL